MVSGSDRKKVLQQVPSSILSRCDGAFCSMANEFWDNEKGLIYRNKWTPPENLICQLNDIILNSDYEEKTGNHIEHRPGMINFSIIGRNASHEGRDRYNKWDLENKERASTCAFLRTEYPDLDISIGGQISIDINPRGSNKSQATRWVRENSFDTDTQFVFFGDKCHYGGNDYDIVGDITRNKDGVFFQVSGPKEALGILTSKY